MGKVLENFSKQLLRQNGVSTPDNWVVETGSEAEPIAEERDVVLKALVTVGKRGKAGAIKFPKTSLEAKNQTEQLLKMKVGHFPVKKVLVEEKIDIKKEWYLSIAFDTQKQLPVIIATTEGGIEVENLIRDYPEKVAVFHADPFKNIETYQAKQIWSSLGVTGSPLVQATSLLCNLYAIFVKYDCYILEVNPLILTNQNKVVAAASVMGVDDSALFRQPELNRIVEEGSERSWRPLTQLEKEMVKVNNADYRGTARYTEMEGGDIGFMCGGGGGSLVSFDALTRFGGKPANYTETGGNPPLEKVYKLTKGILSKTGVKGLFVSQNITNNTQIDVMAEGIVKALRDLEIDVRTFPVAVRQAGVNDKLGKKIFEEAGVTYYGEEVTIEQAAEKMVQSMGEVYQWQS